METKIQNFRPLVIDTQGDSRLVQESEAGRIILARGAVEARAALANSALSYHGIFVNPAVDPPFAVPLVRLALQNRPLVPIFYLSDGIGTLMSTPEMENLSVRSVLHKTDSIEEIKRIALEVLEISGLSGVLRKLQETTLPERSNQEKESSFVPIQARGFIPGAESVFDVFVRLSSGRFVRVLSKGDFFTADRIDSYLRKGVDHLYLRKEVQEHYLQYYDQVTTEILKRYSVPADFRIEQTVNYGLEVRNLLNTGGITAKAIQAAEKFAVTSHGLVERLKLDNDARISAFLLKMANVEEGVAATMLAAVFMDQLGFSALKSTQTMGVAAFLHHVGMPEDLLGKDPRGFQGEARQRYEAHPEIGAGMLSTFSEISSAVTQAIAQHHERKDRSGFPHQIGVGQIGRISEVVGATDELIQIVSLVGTLPATEMEDEYRQRFVDRFSSPVVEVCARMLNLKKLKV